MSRFYCPFCSNSYQFYKTRSDGVLICGQCGDPLLEKPLIKPKQIIGIIAFSAFLSPLLFMLIFLFMDFTKEQNPSSTESVSLVFFKDEFK